jgi:Family of unknown function (DUF5681)
VEGKDDKKDYEVGYGRPPQETRFVKGQSGNRRGRPKGSQNLDTIVAKISRQRVNVTGKRGTRSVARIEATVELLSNQALSGKLQAMREYLQLHRFSSNSEQAALLAPAVHERDKAVMESILKRLRQTQEPESPDLPDLTPKEPPKDDQ